MQWAYKWRRLFLGLLLSAMLSALAGCGDDPFCLFDADIISFGAVQPTINSGDMATLVWNADFDTEFCDLYATNGTLTHELIYSTFGDDTHGVTLTETTDFELRCYTSNLLCADAVSQLTVTVN